MIGHLAGRVGVDVLDAEARLDLGQTAFGGHDRALRLVHLVILVAHEAEHGLGELLIHLGGLHAGAGDDQRRAGLVDQDRVDLVDDGEMMPALDALVGAGHHVVSQIVEAELGVSAVRDIGLVGGNALGRTHAVLDQTDLHAQKAVDPAHPFAVSASKVVVHRDDMHVFARQGIQVARQRRNERLALARAHLGDLAVVERHGADQLHVEMTQTQRTHAGLAHRGERLGKDGFERFAVGDALLVFRRQGAQFFVAALLHGRFERVDLGDLRLIALELLSLAEGEELR